MKIAIVGSGISGLVAAHHLHWDHDVTVYEADARIGGHTHTVDVELGSARYAVDTGFIVYNESTYPHFTRLLDRLGVETRPSEMSFGLHCEQSGVEWSSRGLRGVLAQPSNLLRGSFREMLRDVLRFNREAPALLGQGWEGEKVALGDYLCGEGYSRAFVEHYVVPMGAAIWSADPEQFLRMPARTFVRFFQNHGLLAVRPPLRWRTVCGGSSRYVEKLVAPFRERILVGCPVYEVTRRPRGVLVESAEGLREFDRVVMALHSDQALRLLGDPTYAEQRVLGSIGYQANEVVLHTDESVLPHRRAAQASWNYTIPSEPNGRVFVTYDMNRLQGIEAPVRFLVSLNAGDRIAPERVLGRYVYHHPVFDARAVTAQQQHGAINGAQRTYYCGAYWGHGFHEDGVRSALEVCRAMGLKV